MTHPPGGPTPVGEALRLQAVRIRRRVFSASPGEGRYRRASDVIVLVPALAALALLVAAFPPTRTERALSDLLAAMPSWLDPLWGLLYDGLALWAVAIVVATIVGRRSAVAGAVVTSAVVATGISVLAFRLAVERWPDWDYILRLRVEDLTFPVLRVALCATVILAAAHSLVRPLRTTGRWVLTLGSIGAVLGQDAPTGATIGALLAAVVAATLVRYVFGTSAGHPATGDVVASLAELGVDVPDLQPAARQWAGAFIARAYDPTGAPILVKVYGRDAYDTQLLEKVWRTLWYRGDGPRVRLTRQQAVEHEALLTMLAGQAGVPTRGVVIAGESSTGDALLVMRDDGVPFSEMDPDDLDDARLAGAWAALGRLAAARIAHLRIAPETLVAIGDETGLVDFDWSTVAQRTDQLMTDRAQMLAATAAVAGPERAVRAARLALGSEGVATLLAYLQPAAFTPSLRQALRAAEVDPDELRTLAAEAVDAEAPELIRFRRISWWSLVQVALLAFAISTIVGGLSGIDFAELWGYLQDADWGWIVLGFVVAQLPRITQAISTLGSVAVRLPFVPVYLMQLATGYMNVALPSNLARMAVNVRFFQRQGIPPVTAVTAGTIDSFAGTVIQAILLGVLLLFSESSLNLDLDVSGGPSMRALLILIGILLLAVVALALTPRVRRAVAERVRRWWPEVREAITGLRASNKLALLLGGNLATELLFATAIGVFANAFGYDIGLADLLIINISASLLASLVPVPGGIGVVEFAISVGLVAAGMPEEAALATALLYRGATFYLPPIWGFVALGALRRNALI